MARQSRTHPVGPGQPPSATAWRSGNLTRMTSAAAIRKTACRDVMRFARRSDIREKGSVPIHPVEIVVALFSFIVILGGTPAILCGFSAGPFGKFRRVWNVEIDDAIAGHHSMLTLRYRYDETVGIADN